MSVFVSCESAVVTLVWGKVGGKGLGVFWGFFFSVSFVNVWVIFKAFDKKDITEDLIEGRV